MKTLLVIGAGPALGMSMARRFGREGYQVGLISRTQSTLDGYVAVLAKEGIKAAGFAADVLDRDALVKAIRSVEAALGPVDVLEYSPTPKGEDMARPENLTVDNVMHQISYTLLGEVAATAAVLPGMLERGEGALLYTGGLSSKIPVPSHGSAGLALAAQRNLAFVMNHGLASKGIYAGTITVAGLIARSFSDEMMTAQGMRDALKDFIVDPDMMADLYWDMMTKRDRVEEVVGNPAGVETAAWR